MTNYQLMRLVSQYERYFGHRVNTQLIRTGCTCDGTDLKAALVLAMEKGVPLPELVKKARWSPVAGRARCRLRQKRYRLAPRERAWREG